MKVDGSAEGSLGGGVLVSQGIHPLEFVEGTKFTVNAETKAQTVVLCLQTLKPAEIGANKIHQSICVVTGKGELMDRAAKTLGDLLMCTGLAEEFEKKFPDDVKITDEEVIKLIPVKLLGRRLYGLVTHFEEEYQGRQVPKAKVTRVWATNPESGKVSTKGTAPAATVASEAEDF